MASIATPSRTPRLTSSCSTQFPNVESPIPKSWATYAIGFPVLVTISTASHLNSSLNFRLGLFAGLSSFSCFSCLSNWTPLQRTHRPLSRCPAHGGNSSISYAALSARWYPRGMGQPRLHNRVERSMGRAVGIWALIGLAAVLLAVLFQPQYLPLCEQVNDGYSCGPVSKPVMAGYFLVALGVIAVMVAPIVLGLRAKTKTDERSSQAVWRATNYGLLVGFLYVGAGALLLVLSS